MNSDHEFLQSMLFEQVENTSACDVAKRLLHLVDQSRGLLWRDQSSHERFGRYHSLPLACLQHPNVLWAEAMDDHWFVRPNQSLVQLESKQCDCCFLHREKDLWKICMDSADLA